MSQNSYTNSVSLQAQESICSKFAHKNNLKVNSVYKEVHSAFTKAPNVLSTVIELKNCTIIISDVSRFSRSVKVGTDMAKIAFKNNNQLVFIQEKLACSSIVDLPILTQYLQKTESESKTIGLRVKKAHTYLIDNGLCRGGHYPYGYNVIDRRAIKNQHEQDILQFIRACQQKRIVSDDLNNMMINITNIRPHVPIECYDKDSNVVAIITQRLTNREIADLLNSYSVTKRGLAWNFGSVNTALISNNRQNKNSNRDMATKPKLESLGDWNVELNQVATTPKRQRPTATQNNLSFDTPDIQQQPTRRSNRTNPGNSVSPNIDDGINAIDKDDYDKLLKQFRQFRQFRNMLLL
jgi:DNA invertase Pin-like site-specific DNA recombinase